MNGKEYFDIDFRDILAHSSVSRREFLKRIGGGIVILIWFGELSIGAGRRRRGGYPEDFNAYLRVGEDGRVTCFSGKIEMGQGVVTSLAQMLADELDVSFESIDMVMGDTALCPWDTGTFGSMSTRFFGPALRAAGAEARAVLIELASEQLGIPEGRLKTKNGVVFDADNESKRISYAELAKGKKIARHVKADLKKVSEFKIMGKPFRRADAEQKVTGRARYAGDIRVPGMLYARILRPPAHRAKLKNIDTSAAERIKGIQIVRDEELIAVLHEYPDIAEKALSKIIADFEIPEEAVDDVTIFKHLENVATESEVVDSGGAIRTGENLASQVVEQTYLNSYVAHAPIETHTALAKVEANNATIWASTQAPFRLQEQVAELLDMDTENVRVITPFVGGGFGGKTRGLQTLQAARLSKATGKPVQVAWTRGDEFFYDTFRPAAMVKIRAGINEAGKIVFWDYGVYFAGERGSQAFYDIPHHRTVSFGGGWRGEDRAHPFGTGAWRAPANNTNTFARESHIDIMAAEVQMDPLEFRLKNLRDKRMIRVLEAAAKKFGWTPAKPPSGRGYGTACGIDSGTYVATMAEVQVDKDTGLVQVKRVVCAQDMGIVINPEGARLQMEGCITMGLGYALTEEIHFKGGQIFDLQFDTYELPRFSWLPQIETVLVKADDIDPQGGGEPAIIVMGAVIANAICDAIGARLFQLPMTPERIKKTLAVGSQARELSRCPKTDPALMRG